MGVLVLSYPDAAAAGAGVAGGKGWNLGRLHRYGFPVPPGGVLAAEAYTRFMALPQLDTLKADFAHLTAEDAATSKAAEALAALRATIEAAPLPAEAATAVQAFLDAAGLAQVPVAVRSSATAEDGTAASFAGIHRSVLGVVGAEAALGAIRVCYASLWTPQALAYRRRMAIADDTVACAVVLCAMVGGPGGGPPAAAGVAFSCDPRTGRRDRIVIEAAPGLGEAVASGHLNPEEITLSVDGRRLVERGRGRTRQPVLTAAQAQELARVVLRIQWALGRGQDPQDVEWAHDGRRLWILQARPATRVPRVAYPAVAALPVIWSNGNLKDAVPGVLTTLTWDTVEGVVRGMLFTALERAGYGGLPGGQPMRRIRGRAYFDVTNLQWAFYDAFGYEPRRFNLDMGGHQPEIPVPAGDPFRGRAGLRRRRAKLRLIWVLWGNGRAYAAETARLREEARRLRRLALAPLPNDRLLNLLDEQMALVRPYAQQFQLGNALLWDSFLIDLLERYRPGRARAIAAGLMAGSGQVVSAEHGYRLFDLATAAAGDAQARAYLEGRPLDPEGWRRLPAESAFRRAFEAFLEDFGHRAVYEAEMANPRWREDPTFLLEQVRLHLADGGTPAPRAAARAALEAADAELRHLPFWARPMARWLAKSARASAARREAGKSALAALYEPVRMLAMEIGRRMAAAGVLDAPGDVFHLCWADLQAYLAGEWDGAGARVLVADSKARRETWLAEDADDYYVLDADGRPAHLPAASPAIAVAAAPVPEDLRALQGTRLAGVGVAAGRAAGRARIVRHPGDGRRLERGEILIAPSTDPGWTPLFLRAAGVVMEIGGYLSHGAIVAREYGIPAVVNIPGLLGAVTDGQQVTVDGDTGWILLSPSRESSRARISPSPSKEGEGGGEGGRQPQFPSPP